MIVSVDPGLTGALVAIDQGRLDVLDMPTITTVSGGKKRRRIDIAAVRNWLHSLDQCHGGVDHVVCEQVASRPGEGTTSSFNFGRGYGQIEGICCGLELAWSTVTPQTWTKAFGAGSDKKVHLNIARTMFPAQPDLFRRVRDNGRADAALIGLWLLEHQ